MFFNFKQYSCFFAAIFIVQFGYGLVSIAATNNNSVEKGHVTEEYKYDLVFRDLNEEQYIYLKNYRNNQFDKNSKLYIIEDYTETYSKAEDANVYDVYLTFREGDEKQAFEDFWINYAPTLKSVSATDSVPTYEKSPLINFAETKNANAVSFLIITAVFLVVAVVLMVSLYNIRMNQYKFTYGVYMTYGADFKMLFGTAFWEMFIISLVTYLPAIILANVGVWLIYRPSGFGFAFSGISFLWVALFSLVVVAASVYMPMQVMSLRQPMSLIKTEDNSNLVTSPRRSFNILGKKFPMQYELYSVWRFRKYNIQLLTTAIGLCALFICGLYLSNIYTIDLEYPRAQFTLDLSASPFEYDSQLCDDLYAIDGITGVEVTGEATPTENINSASPVTEAMYVSRHVLINRNDLLFFRDPFKSFVSYKQKDYTEPGKYVATNEVLFKAVDEDQLRLLEQYEVVGDVTKVLKNDGDTKYVIVADSMTNIRNFKFEPGDKIAISSRPKSAGNVGDKTGAALLRAMMNLGYEYETYEICAVVKNIPTNDLPIYLNHENYEDAVDRPATTQQLNIFVDPERVVLDNELTEEAKAEGKIAVGDIEKSIRAIGHDQLGNIVLKNTRVLSDKNISLDKHYSELYICLSVLILLVSPIMWFFSQTLYYMKREKEFNIIQSMGAKESDIRKIYLLGGLSMAVMSLVVSIALSYIASYIMFYAYNVWIPMIDGEYVRYSFSLPWYSLLISVIMSVACGFFSAYIPYKNYFKYRYSLENGGSGEFDGDE